MSFSKPKTNLYSSFFCVLIFLLLLFVNNRAIANDTTFLKPVINFGDTTKTNIPVGNYKSFLALGDSYTIGQSVDSSERFPAQAAAMLKHRGYYIPSIDYIATTGWKTVNLQWAIEAQRNKKKYDIVTLLIGVNDQYLKKDTAEYRAHFVNLIQKAIGYAANNQAHVFVLSIPDYSVTPFGHGMKWASKQIDQFNVINKDISKLYGVNYLDITGISRYDAIDNLMLAPDDMHPSGRQYEQWARALTNKMLTVFQ